MFAEVPSAKAGTKAAAPAAGDPFGGDDDKKPAAGQQAPAKPEAEKPDAKPLPMATRLPRNRPPKPVPRPQRRPLTIRSAEPAMTKPAAWTCEA